MKLSEIKIGDHISFKTEGLMSYIHNGEGACTLSGNHVHPIQDIVTIKGEQYLKFWDCMHLKVSELYEKGILIREHTFSPGDEVVMISEKAQSYGPLNPFEKGWFMYLNEKQPWEVEEVSGEYFKAVEHIYWLKQSDFKKKETMTKQVSKEKFTVQGSTRLRKALADELKEEAGFQVCAAISLDGMNYDKYLTPGADKVVGVTNDKATIHYILPGDWDKSLQAFKDYFTPEYKIGDIVVVDGSSYNNEKDFIAELSVVEINDYWVNNPGGLDSNYGREYDKSGSYKRLCVDKLIKRLATEEEIEQYKASKEKITVAGYEMHIAQGMAKFGCQIFTIQEIETIGKLLDLNATINIGGTEITPHLIDKIISKLK